MAVTVKVPRHKELVNLALDAKKMVFCEWPLGNGLAEAEAMAAYAKLGGVLESGVVVSAHYRAGLSRGTNLLWEINGSKGDLQITAPMGHLQLAELTLFGGRREDKSLSLLEIPAKYRTVAENLTGPVVAVAEEYARFAEGPESVEPLPDFEVAVKLHRLLDAMERSAQTGEHIIL